MSRAWLAVLLASSAIACGGDSSGPIPVAAVDLNRTTAHLIVGDSVLIVATTRDADGNTLTNRAVNWVSTNGSVASVSSAGWVKALSGGSATISATSETITSDLQVTVTAPVAAIELDPTSVTLVIGDSALIDATPRDVNGGALSNRVVTWSTNAAGVATVTSAGWVKGIGSGIATVTATSESVSEDLQVTVNSSSTLLITSIVPAVLTPDASAVLTGSGFAPTLAQNSVTVGGLAATVTAASSTELTVSLPAASQFPCLATHNAVINVTANGETGSTSHPLQIATQQSLNAGESIMFASTAQATCNEFEQTGGRYFVTVHRPDNGIGGLSSFKLKGTAASAVSPRILPPVPLPRPTVDVGAPRTLLAPFRTVDLARQAERARRHRQILEENTALLGGRLDLARRRAPRSSQQLLSRTRASFAIATVGDTNDIKIPNRNSAGNHCEAAPFNVRARTVYSGTRAIILEDVASPLAGQFDSYYIELGEEFDDVMYPIVTGNFGDPLAYDASLDANGKLLMLFSKQINDFGGILAFVTSCDFLDRATFPTAIASNEAEIFYAIAPDEAGTGFNTNGQYTRDEWRRIIRSTLIHEAKHLAMFAERFASPSALVFETSWLEEGMAMHSEELYSRAITGATWKGNTGYGSMATANHIWCELRPTTAACAGRPYVVTSHFGFLNDYLTDIENRTILGGAPGLGNDNSFYGSSWAFVRWMLDAYATNEASVLKALTVEPTLAGTANLTARSGIPFDVMLPQFHYALQYDDIAGIAPVAPWQHIASWNLPNIYAGFTTDLGIPADYLKDHPLPFGAFTVNINALRGGTAAHFEISGAQAGKQLIALQSLTGGAADPLLRMSVFRVQ